MDGSDDEFSYGDSMGDSTAISDSGAPKTQFVQNRPYDEAMELSDNSMEESIETNAMSQSLGQSLSQSRGKSATGRGNTDRSISRIEETKIEESTTPQSSVSRNDNDTPPRGDTRSATSSVTADHSHAEAAPQDRMEQENGLEMSSSAEDDEESISVSRADGYDAGEYAHLNVSSDVKALFEYITAFQPHQISLDTKLKPFIPDYIPALGDIDAFLKPSRPDNETEELGLRELDEPAAQQSDPTVLDLQLRSMSKKSNLQPTTVRSIEHADKNPREITKWINSIQDLHRNKPPPQVQYAKTMPDIEALMQVWPERLEDMIREMSVAPGSVLGRPAARRSRESDHASNIETGTLANMDLSLEEMTRVICSLLDIPVYEPKPGRGTPSERRFLVQSLHVLFTLYNEFRTNQHFQQIGGMAGDSLAGIGGANVLALDSDDEEEHKQ